MHERRETHMSETTTDKTILDVQERLQKSKSAVFPIGEENVQYEKYFTGKSYVAQLGTDATQVFNVTFVDGAHNDWHIHHEMAQIVLAVSGEGRYQIWGEETRSLHPGDAVIFPAGVKHWHGAAMRHDFQHVVIIEAKEGARTEWLEKVEE